MNTNEMTPRALTAAALSGQIDRQPLTMPDRVQIIEAMRRRLDEAESDAIAEFRMRGGTWADVGETYGITRQAAQMRFRHTAAGTLDKLDEHFGRKVKP